MGTVTISGNVYDVYGDLPASKIYLLGSMGAGPNAWNASVDDVKKSRALVQARRFLDAMRWQGTKTSAVQTLDWPRSGVVDAEGIAVDSATIPTAILEGEYELAAILMVDESVLAAMNSGSNVKRVNAKGVEVEFFAATNVAGKSVPMPVVVMRLVGQYLASAIGNSAAAAYYTRNSPCATTNTEQDSSFTDCNQQGLDGPIG